MSLHYGHRAHLRAERGARPSARRTRCRPRRRTVARHGAGGSNASSRRCSRARWRPAPPAPRPRPRVPPAAASARRWSRSPRAEIGVAESPPGSNNSPRIAAVPQRHRRRPGPGPVVRLLHFLGRPARPARRSAPNGSRLRLRRRPLLLGPAAPARPCPRASSPQPGDLIVWDEHIGIVESVGPNGQVNTIEGNSSDQVTRRQHAAGSAARLRAGRADGEPLLTSPTARMRPSDALAAARRGCRRASATSWTDWPPATRPSRSG